MNVVKTTNPFALVLGFYDRYKRNMINTEGLSKIAKKYFKKPPQLITDLKIKYNDLEIPADMAIVYLAKLVSTHDIPECFKILLPEICNMQYADIYDVASDKFSAEAALNSATLISSQMSTSCVDNLSKVKHLVPGFDGITPILGPVYAARVKTADEKEKNEHVLSTIAKLAVSKSNTPSELPLSLLQKFVQDRSRIRVIVRRRGGVRGTLCGFVRAFDKHFNLLLADVDEEYVPLRVGTGKGRFPLNQLRRHGELEGGAGAGIIKVLQSDTGVLKRHLAQLLVRGDNIILLNKCDKNIAYASSIRPSKRSLAAAGCAGGAAGSSASFHCDSSSSKRSRTQNNIQSDYNNSSSNGQMNIQAIPIMLMKNNS